MRVADERRGKRESSKRSTTSSRRSTSTSLVYTGEHEDFFFYVEGELIRRLGVEVAGKLHTGRSRNDIDHTVFKLALKDRLAALLTEHAAMIEALLAVAERERETIVVAYTHGQPAQPTTYGHYLAAFIELSLRDMDRLLHAVRTVDLSSMGAAAITTSGFGLDRARMAELLGFADVQENSYGCIAAADYATGVYAAMKLLFIHAGRFVQDLNAWTGFEIGHLRVPDAFVQISSIMPQKRNPVPVEHLRLMASLGAARCEAVLTAVHNTPFTDMNDSEGEVQIAGYEAFDTAHRLMALLGGLLAAVTIDSAKVRTPYRRSRDYPGRACRFPGAHGGDLVPSGARSCEQTRTPHDRRRHDAVQGSVHRIPGDIRRGDRPARALERGRLPALHHTGAFHCRAHHARRTGAGAARRQFPTLPRPRSRPSARLSTRSPRANAPRKPCWRAKSPAASPALSCLSSHRPNAWRNWH